MIHPGLVVKAAHRVWSLGRLPAPGSALVLTGLLMLPAAGFGQTTDDGLRGWVDVGAGVGGIRVDGSPRESAFALDFSGGIWLGQRVGLGLRLGGWTIEGFDLWNPEEGESISEAFAVLALRPWPDYPLSLAVESGRASYVVNDLDRLDRKGGGLGWRLAGSWIISVSERFSLAPSLVFSRARIHPDRRGERSFDYSSTGILLRLGWGW